MKIYKSLDFTKIKGKNISFVNPANYPTSRNLSTIDIWLSDGILICILFKLFGKSIKRQSFDFSSLATPTLEWCKREDLSIYLIGSHIDEITYFQKYIQERFQVNVVHAQDGYFTGTSIDSTLGAITRTAPDVVIVGMGAPLQENFLAKLRELGWKGTGFTCGGFIHQTYISKGNYYPNLIEKFHLRALYRFIKEPHTRRRYMKQYPTGIRLVISDLIQNKLTTNKEIANES